MNLSDGEKKGEVSILIAFQFADCTMNSVCETCAYVDVVHYALGRRLKTLMQIEYVHTKPNKDTFISILVCGFTALI